MVRGYHFNRVRRSVFHGIRSKFCPFQLCLVRYLLPPFVQIRFFRQWFDLYRFVPHGCYQHELLLYPGLLSLSKEEASLNEDICKLLAKQYNRYIQLSRPHRLLFKLIMSGTPSVRTG